MSSMTKTVLATIVLLGSVTLAQANSFDPNLANRYPSYAEPGVYGYSASGGAPQRLQPHALHSRDVSLPRQSALCERSMGGPRVRELQWRRLLKSQAPRMSRN